MIPCSFCFELSSCVIACDEICLTRRARLYRLPTSIYPISSCICHTHTRTHMGIAFVFVFVLCTGPSIFICAFTFHQLRLLLSLLLPLPLPSFPPSSLPLCLWLYQNPFLFVRVVSLRKRKMRTFFSFLYSSFAHFSQQTTAARGVGGQRREGGSRVGLTIQNTRQM